MYSDIAQQKRWSDACKMAKMQPRPKRNVKSKSANIEDEENSQAI